MNELVKTKKENAKMRLYLQVLVEKINKNDRAKGMQDTVGALDGDFREMTFEEHFFPLQGKVVAHEIVTPNNRNWSDVVVPNCERVAGAELQFIPPLEHDGVKLVSFERKEVEEEVHIWKKALIVYVLGAKPPFHVMRNYFDRK